MRPTRPIVAGIGRLEGWVVGGVGIVEGGSRGKCDVAGKVYERREGSLYRHERHMRRRSRKHVVFAA